MRPTLIPALAVLAAIGELAAQRPQHSVALVNDPRSHGQIGDNLLSLNEAILLHNRALSFSQLSPAEQAQINGTTDVSWADLDYTVVPVVTLERDLDAVTNLPHGLVIGGTSGKPAILVGNTRGFLVDSDFCDFRNLVIRGGTTAITVTQRDTFYGSIFEGVVFEGQSLRAVHVTLVQDDGETLLGIENCTFRALPNGFRIDDVGRNRRGTMWMRGCSFEGGGDGFELALGPGTNGYTLTIDRSRFEGMSGTAFAIRRPTPSASRGIAVEFADLRTRNVQHGIVVDGHPTAATDGIFRMVECGGSATGLTAGGAGSNSRLTVHDSRLLGSATLGGSRGVEIDNCVLAGGLITGTVAAAPHTMTQSVLLGSTVATQGGAALTIGGCRFGGGSVAGTASAPVNLTGCHLGGVNLGPNTTATGSIPVPQLGMIDASPLLVGIGQIIDLDHSLPPGLVGVWLFGLAADGPALVQGLRVYINMTTWVVYPGAWRDTGRVPFPVPPIPALRQLDLMFQMVVGHDAGVPAPRLVLPPGRRVMIR